MENYKIIAGRWRELVKRLGQRYEDATLKNFIISNADQRQLVATLLEYCQEVHQRVMTKRQGIVLFGPEGGGKDHLLTAVARAAIRAGITVHWENGSDIYAARRDCFKTGETEDRLVRRLVKPDVLWISDPIPPEGALKIEESDFLWRILDGRYRQLRPTWFTVNVLGGTELEDKLTAKNASRMRDGALTWLCNWPSVRKAAIKNKKG